ncbi:CHAT domain-containing protein [bacterium]|nr:CHAT domain-containing protein [bacterium]
MTRLLLFMLLLCPLALAEPRPESRARTVLHSLLGMAERRAIQFGNYQEAVSVLRFHRQVLAAEPQPGYALFLNRMEVLALIAAGRTFEADQVAAGWEDQDPLHQGMLRALALALGARPDEVRQQLGKLGGKKLGPMNSFMLATLQFHLDWLQANQPESAIVAHRFRAALDQLKNYNSARENTTGEAWFIEQGLKLWEGPMLTLIHTENQDPGAQQALLDAYFEGQRKMHELAQANLTPKTLNPEFNFMVLDNLLTSYEDFLAYLWLERSQSQQKELEELFGDLEPGVRSAAEKSLQSHQELEKMMEPMLQGVTFQGQPYRPALLQHSQRDGSMARLLSRFKTIQLRSLWNLSEGKLDRALAGRARLLLDEATREQRRLGLKGIYLGLQDIRFDEVEWLLRQQEQGWQSRASRLLNTLQGEAGLQHYPPAQARALALAGRLELSQDHLEAAEQLVEQAVALTEKGTLGFDLSASALVERRRRNTRLYRLLSEIRMRRGNPEGALASLEQERQAQAALAQGVPSQEVRRLELREALAAESRAQSAPVPGLADYLASLDHADWASATAQAVAPKLSSLTLLRQQLPPSTSVISYLPLEKELRIFVIRPDGLVMRSAPVGQGALYKEVRKFRAWIVAAGKTPTGANSRQLYDWLIAPIAKDISADSTLAVVASGPLNYVPFAALQGPPDQPGYLGRHKICVNMVGVSDILRLSEAPRAPSGRLLALGNPDGTLPGASDEVKAIATMFVDPLVYLGTRANRQSLHWTGAPPDCLHIATHGQLDSSHPQASFLVLAGHKLRVSEIYSLPLKGTELVALSACQTALGEVEPGSEITSLADAFQVAGSRSVLASLWNVADGSTSQFMQAFYRNRQKHGLGQAFHLAQLELMRQPATAHPYYWAPFILLGDFR